MNFMKNKFNKESGFSLVELTVVIVIIGILSAIALPIYFNSQKEAHISTLKTDVTNLATSVGVKAADRDYDDTSVISYSATERTKFQSNGNTLIIKFDPALNDYCIQGIKTIKTTNDTQVFFILSDRNIATGACPTSYSVTVI